MNVKSCNASSRRDFLKTTGRIAAVSALAGVAIPSVHAGEDNTIQLALIGSGGRGSGAVVNGLSVPNGNAKLVAMADVFSTRLENSLLSLKKRLGDKIDVPADRQFIGFDAYRKAIDCLRPGDVAVLTTHCAFRPVHLEYAVEKGVNVFMEKPFASDPAGAQRVLRAGEAAEKKNLKIGAGLMCRHSASRQAMIQKVRDGAMGQIQLLRAYRMDAGHRMAPRNTAENELITQIKRPFYTIWSGGGLFLDYTIHQIDECCWVKDAWPVSAHGLGGRASNNRDCSQNLDAYSIEFTFADGTKAFVSARYTKNCFNAFETFVHGTKCAGQFSGSIHAPTVYTCKDQRISNENIDWKPPREQTVPHQAEWNVLIDAIRNDRPHNEAKRGAFANIAAIMGRAAVHTGKIITWEEAMNSKFSFCKNIDSLTFDSPAPAQSNAQGAYPVPAPGVWSEL